MSTHATGSCSVTATWMPLGQSRETVAESTHGFDATLCAAPRASPLPHAPVKPGTGSSAAPSPAESGGEEDIGLEGYAPVGCSPVYSERTGNVGPTTGDPEKDSYGATVTGLTCP